MLKTNYEYTYMGRYYWGNIEGKFWFGVQCSSDISNILNISYISNK